MRLDSEKLVGVALLAEHAKINAMRSDWIILCMVKYELNL